MPSTTCAKTVIDGSGTKMHSKSMMPMYMDLGGSVILADEGSATSQVFNSIREPSLIAIARSVTGFSIMNIASSLT
jgi:hypothetical protein